MIIKGDCIEELKKLPEQSINMCMTSPPYWALRDYGTATWNGGKEDCDHQVQNNIKEYEGDWDRPSRKEFNKIGTLLKCQVCSKEFNGKIGNKFCSIKCLNTLSNDERTNATSEMINTCPKCGAKRVDKQLGLEPTFDEYINKLCDIFDEVKRVLRKDGTCWVNIGDTYYTKSGSGFIDDNLTKNDKLKNQIDLEGNEVKDTDEEKVSNTTGINKANELRGTKQYWDGKNFVQKLKKRKRFCCECGSIFDAFPNQYFCSPACSGVDNTPRELKGEFPSKTLTMIPMRFAIEMVNRGWILRNVIIWHKRNCMPSSAKDRFTVDFEYLFFFSKDKKYYFETQYEPMAESTKERYNYGWDGNTERGDPSGINNHLNNYIGSEKSKKDLEKGRNKRTVWTINPKPFKEAHFAVYPEELCETPIKAGCPEFVCVKCGKPREKIMESNSPSKEIIDATKEDSEYYKVTHVMKSSNRQTIESLHRQKGGVYSTAEFKGLSDCGCNAGFTGGIVLDPFFGSGTTGLVALKQNKKFIGIELNKEYIEIAKARLKPYLEQRKLSFDNLNKQTKNSI